MHFLQSAGSDIGLAVQVVGQVYASWTVSARCVGRTCLVPGPGRGGGGQREAYRISANSSHLINYSAPKFNRVVGTSERDSRRARRQDISRVLHRTEDVCQPTMWLPELLDGKAPGR